MTSATEKYTLTKNVNKSNFEISFHMQLGVGITRSEVVFWGEGGGRTPLKN